jgi:hypothetical protein
LESDGKGGVYKPMKTKFCECGCGREFEIKPCSRQRRFFSKECFTKSITGVKNWQSKNRICGDDNKNRGTVKKIIEYYNKNQEAFKIDWNMEPTKDNLEKIAKECIRATLDDISALSLSADTGNDVDSEHKVTNNKILNKIEKEDKESSKCTTYFESRIGFFY